MKSGRQLGTLRSRIVIAGIAALTFVTGAAYVIPQMAKADPGDFKANVNPDPPFTGHNANVTEGNFGTSPVNVGFELTDDHSNQVTVHYTTGEAPGDPADTATPDDDYVTQTSSVVFAPHETSKNVVFNAKGDTADEPNEFFTVRITSVDNATGTGASTFTAGTSGTVTISDDDAAPNVSLPDKEGTEGTGGTTKIKMTATLSAPKGSDTTFTASTGTPTRDADPNTDGVQPHRAATAGTDYTSLTNQEVTIKAGDTTKDFDVTVTADTRDEFDEWFAVVLKDGNNNQVAYGEGQITDDDALARLDVLDPQAINEGNAACDGLQQPTCPTLDFTVSLTPASDKRVVVNYATEDRTAKAGEDYTSTSGSGDPATPPPNQGDGLVFAAGVTTQVVHVPIHGDGSQEPDESFVLNLLSATNAQIGDGQATGLITNDDGGTFPSVHISDGTASTGGAGGNPTEATNGTPGTANFTVTASRPPLTCNCPAATADIDVFYQTADGPENGTGPAATSTGDYVAQNSHKLISYPNTTATITVNLKNDNQNEADEFFQVQLTGASNAAITDGIGEATIKDDDPAPTLSIGDFTVAEGTSSTPADGTMTITLSVPSGQPVSVHYSTPTPNGGTASDTDYTNVPDTKVTFDPGQTTKTFVIPVIGDNIDEDNETVQAQLSGNSGAGINDGLGVLTITDDDGPPAITISNFSGTEGSDTNTTASFVVKLSNPSSKTVSVNVGTGDGTATAPADYTAKNQTLTFAPGDPTEQNFDVTVVADTIDEANETFTATLSAPNANATLGTPKTGTATIVDDDAGPSFAINNATVTEGNSGTTNATFTITKTGTTTQTVAVHYATADGTATQPGDYTATSGDLSFAPNETAPKTITVPVKGDTTVEPNEGFTVNLTAPTNGATISDGTGNGTITNDDNASTAPNVGVGNATATEGDPATFTFTLSATTDSDVTVNYSTADGSAKAATDYTAVPAGVATIKAGDTTTTANVATTEDTTHEPQETFTLTINGANGANVDSAKKTGTGTINDDDAAVTKPQVTTGAGPGGGPHIQSFESYKDDPPAVTSFMDGAESTGKRVARGDVNGDGIDEIITGSGPGSASVVSVYSAAGQELASSFAYAGGRFYGGVFVAAADINGDGKDEVITGAGPGGGPHVIVWKVTSPTLTPIGGFMAYGSFSGGVTVAAADVTGDGKAEIITAPGAGGGPDIEVFSYSVPDATQTRMFGFMAYTDPQAQPNWTGGVNVAAGDLDGDGKAEIVTGPWNGGGPHLRTFEHDGALRNGGVFAGNPSFTGGITVAVGDLNGDGKAEIIVGAFSLTNAVKGYTNQTPENLAPIGSVDFKPYGNFGGGNFVAVGKA